MSKQTVSITKTNGTTAPPVMNKPGRKTLSPTEKAERLAQLKAESKSDKLTRIAKHRVTKAVNDIRLIGNLTAYKPTDDQVDKIMEALGEACARIDARMRGAKRDNVAFSL